MWQLKAYNTCRYVCTVKVIVEFCVLHSRSESLRGDEHISRDNKMNNKFYCLSEFNNSVTLFHTVNTTQQLSCVINASHTQLHTHYWFVQIFIMFLLGDALTFCVPVL